MRTILGGVLGRLTRPTPAMAVALLALLIAASGAAVAAIPSSDGTIRACYAKSTGALRVIDAASQTCNSKETQLTWINGLPGSTVDKAANADNADKLDDKDSTDFYATGSKVADSSHADQADSATSAGDADTLDTKDSTEFLGADQKAADADLLDGQDASAFLGANQKASDADKLDGIDSSGFAAYKRTVVVSPVGTDTENGQALLDAISNITDASASKPYLLHIEPATYDLGDGSLSMKEWVDIEGSGELNTVITSVVATSITCALGTVNGADNAEMRFLTVRNPGANVQSGCKVAISNQSASPRLTHLTAESTGTGALHNIGVDTTNSSTTMTDVTATGSGRTGFGNYGVRSYQSNLTIKQSKLTARDGGPNEAALRIESNPQAPTTTTRVALSQIVGRVSGSVNYLQCFNNYDENMAEVTCPL